MNAIPSVPFGLAPGLGDSQQVQPNQNNVQVADAGGAPPYPLQIETILHGHAAGILSPAQVHSAMPPGWTANLRRGSYEYEVTAPDGTIHYVPP